ncbi:MAG TPA: hypothetical protein VE549_14595, partial [Myxococcaceae bacterium]|nr:hypothetical protein [Myxococcaceae bacterium]
PGNVRELRSVVERLCAFPDLGVRAVEHAVVKPRPEDVFTTSALEEQLKPLVALPYHDARERVLETFERSYLSEQLRLEQGVVRRAALRARLPRQTVHRMIRRHGLRGE